MSYPTLDYLRTVLTDPAGLRFLAKLVPGTVPDHNPTLGPCVMWSPTAAKNKYGYGFFRDGDRIHNAHRWLYLRLHGPIPDGHELDHVCHDSDHCPGGWTCPHRRCVAHLEVKTIAENRLRSNSVFAINARKTHCDGKYSPRAADGTVIGHDWSIPGTVRIGARGRRECIPCDAARKRASIARKRASLAGYDGNQLTLEGL